MIHKKTTKNKTEFAVIITMCMDSVLLIKPHKVVESVRKIPEIRTSCSFWLWRRLTVLTMVRNLLTREQIFQHWRTSQNLTTEFSNLLIPPSWLSYLINWTPNSINSIFWFIVSLISSSKLADFVSKFTVSTRSASFFFHRSLYTIKMASLPYQSSSTSKTSHDLQWQSWFGFYLLLQWK